MHKEMPFDDDIMTLIMGVTPEEPGPHGRMQCPPPTGDAVSLVTKIRDMCEDFLMKAGKEEEGEEKPSEDKPEKKSKPFGKQGKEEPEDEPEEE